MSERQITVEILGDAASLERAFAKSAASAKTFEGQVTKSSRSAHGELGKLERGALAGSGAFKGLGRSVAFASGAFLGAAGLVEVVKSSVDVVLRSQTSIALLDTAIKNAHASVKAMTPILEEHAAAARKLGFEDEQTREAEAKLVTAFGATKKSLDELRVAEDLARAQHEDLATAARQLILLQEGNTRAAKQFGLALPDLTSKQWAAKAAADGLTIAQERGKTLYDQLLPRIKNQAKAYADSPAGKIAEFHAQIEHLQESIGTGLLPIVDKYLTKVDDWLAKGKNQKKITDDVQEVVGLLAGALHDAKKATEKVLDVAKPLVKALGGWKSVIEDIVGLKLATEIAGWTGALVKFGGALKGVMALLGSGGLTGSIALFMANPEVAGFIAALGGIEILSRMGAEGSPNTGGMPAKIGSHALTTGPAGIGYYVGKSVLNYDPKTGTWYRADAATNANGGNISAADAAKLLGVKESTLPGGVGSNAGPLNATQKTELAYAKKFGPGSGITYTWGGVSPITGFDCSGYLMAAYAAAGIKIPHNTVAQFNDPNAIVVLPGGEQPGDGVYFKTNGPGAAPQHVGIYIGGGQFIEYFSQGKPAKISDLATAGGYMGARRWVKIASSDSGGDGSPYGPPASKPPGTRTPPKAPAWKGATQATIIAEQGHIAAMLKGLPSTLDPVEQNAVKHIRAIQDRLHIHMTPAELARDKVELAKWGKVLHDEVTKNGRAAAAAAAEAKKTFDRALSLDMSHVLRDFDENFSRQILAFDRETQRGLAKLAAKKITAVAQTPEEKALADFVAKRNADDLAKSRATQIANAGSSEEAAALTLGFSLDDQQAALEAAAAQSRDAADKAAQDAQDVEDARAAQAQQDYQDERDAQKQHLQDINDDQKIALQNNLDDWTAWLEAKKKSYGDFLDWLRSQGFDTGALINPGPSGSGSGNATSGAATIPLPGKVYPFAAGGIVTRPTVALIGEGREAEGVFPLSVLGGLMGGSSKPLTVIVEMDGQQAARAVVPYQDGIVRVKLR